MALDLNKLAHIHDFDLKKGHTITCGSLNVGMLSEIEKILKMQYVDGGDVSRKVKVLGLIGGNNNAVEN